MATSFMPAWLRSALGGSSAPASSPDPAAELDEVFSGAESTGPGSCDGGSEVSPGKLAAPSGPTESAKRASIAVFDSPFRARSFGQHSGQANSEAHDPWLEVAAGFFRRRTLRG